MKPIIQTRCILIVCLLLLLPPASANGTGHVIGAYGTPTMDGAIQPGEYTSCETSTQSGFTFTFCETNDAVNNYYAFQVDDKKCNASDYLHIFNDNGNDGSLTECDISENYFGLQSDDGYTDGHYCYDPNLGYELLTGDTNQDGSAVLNWASDVGYVYEFRHPLNSTHVNDYHVGPGDTVGWCLAYGNFTGSGDWNGFEYPGGCHSSLPDQSGFGDMLILPSSIADLAGFTGLPTGDVLMVIGDLASNPHGSKPAGVNYQVGRDMTPLGYIQGMMNNSQPSIFDTSAAVNSTTGRPSGDWPIIFSIGGPGINSVSHYYEATNNASDRAPIRFSMNATHYIWTNSTDDEVFAALRSSCNVPPGTTDVFVIQVLRDADGRLVALMYGTHYTGTWAAAEYFKFHVYPTIASWTESYYIVQWTDAASGTSANFLPDSGDTYTIMAQG